MKIGFKKGGLSLTGWETSHFGGYHRTLYDYAEIKLSKTITVTPDHKSDLTFYLGTKLLKLFLLRIKTYGLSSRLSRFSDNKIEKDTLSSFYAMMGGEARKFLVISQANLKHALEELLYVDSEMKSLFKHFEREIINSTIKFEIPEDGEDKPAESYGGALGHAIDEIIEKKPFTYGKGRDNINGDVPPCEYLSVSPVLRPSPLSSIDKVLADQLFKKLDITFDSDVDVIRSLKAGKLDINKLAEAVAGNDHIYHRIEEDQKTKPFSVVMLCDESGSMGSHKIRQQHRLVKIMYEAFSMILPPDKISVYGHTGDEVPNIYIYQDKYNLNFADTIDDMLKHDFCENYDGPVVESLHQRIRSTDSDNILFIVISDGAPYGENYGGYAAFEEFKRIIEKCKRDNFILMGIGFEYDGVKELYKYHTIIDNFSKMVENVSTLLNKVVKTEFQ